jgi:nicotinate-nucleotide pyrophosphorylase (carboxylating)
MDEAVEATWAGADIVLLDNMTPQQIRRAAAAIHREAESMKRNPPEIEISGGITLKSLPVLRYLPIQRISVGAITHSAPGLDIAMHIV